MSKMLGVITRARKPREKSAHWRKKTDGFTEILPPMVEKRKPQSLEAYLASFPKKERLI